MRVLSVSREWGECRRSRETGLTPVILGLTLGCGADSGRPQDQGNGDGGVPSGATTSSGADSAATQGTSGAASNSGPSEDGGSNTPKFDLGVAPDVGLPEDEGCQNVDFLFVIDNSGSMGDNQESLIARFPGFIAGIMSTVNSADSYHLGVVTTDDHDPNPSPCDVPGALVIRTGGGQSSNMMCGPYVEGSNFMTNQDDLATAFACAAKVGSTGDNDERHFRSLGAALEPTMNAPGACNAGFLRDDALLVITVISDENDQSGRSVQEWYDEVVAAKLGIETNVVVLNLAGLPTSMCPPLFPNGPSLPPDEGERQIEFANMFTYGFNGDVCAQSYGDFFQDALMVVEDACDSFTPPG